MEGYDYPFSVYSLNLRIEGQDVRITFMDVKPRPEPMEKRSC